MIFECFLVILTFLLLLLLLSGSLKRFIVDEADGNVEGAEEEAKKRRIEEKSD